jgi:cellulose synthase/poly-beta-1,6-N-acetylglucosamine synthase-like glycosyltransferase
VVFQTVLRGARDTETMQEYFEDLIEMDERKPRISAYDRGRNCRSNFLFIFTSTTYIIKETAAVIFYLFSLALPILLTFSFICFLSFIFRAIFCFINLGYWLIRMTSSTPINPD